MTALVDDPWGRLRGLTAARIGLARSGASLATRPTLEFRLAHARARDAVETALDVDRLAADLGGALCVNSAAPDRRSYKLRPDLGRVLAADAVLPAVTADLAVVVADGLSALAVQSHAAPFMTALRPLLAGWALAPVVIARQGRVAIGDAVAQAMGVGAVLVLIGERPGLSAPDSMGAYLTWRPRVGTTDADRNCVSNIRPEGLPPLQAARRVAWLLGAMRARRISGVALKDEAESLPLIAPPGRRRPLPRHIPQMRRKSDLPSKLCATCGRPFSWRRKWAKVWDEVRYCSESCRRARPKPDR